MSDTSKDGPTLSENVQELQAKFPSDATLQDALSRLTLLGVDRAEMSLPDEQPNAAAPTPDQAEAATSDVDTQQVRTMASGITGTAAGMGVAAVLATGGLAAPLVAAAAGVSALGAAMATTGVGVAADQAGSAERDRLGKEGKLILAVRVRDATGATAITQALRDAGATEVNGITQASDALTRGVNATSWTGG